MDEWPRKIQGDHDVFVKPKMLLQETGFVHAIADCTMQTFLGGILIQTLKLRAGDVVPFPCRSCIRHEWMILTSPVGVASVKSATTNLQTSMCAQGFVLPQEQTSVFVNPTRNFSVNLAHNHHALQIIVHREGLEQVSVGLDGVPVYAQTRAAHDAATLKLPSVPQLSRTDVVEVHVTGGQGPTEITTLSLNLLTYRRGDDALVNHLKPSIAEGMPDTGTLRFQN